MKILYLYDKFKHNFNFFKALIRHYAAKKKK